MICLLVNLWPVCLFFVWFSQCSFFLGWFAYCQAPKHLLAIIAIVIYWLAAGCLLVCVAYCLLSPNVNCQLPFGNTSYLMATLMAQIGRGYHNPGRPKALCNTVTTNYWPRWPPTTFWINFLFHFRSLPIYTDGTMSLENESEYSQIFSRHLFGSTLDE